MAHYHWRELFPPHIWKRGQSYYIEDRVLDIRRRRGCITAEIEGSEVYTVSVTLDPGTNRIEDYYCDCPYAEDGSPCKHLAALLYSLENDDDVVSAEDDEPLLETTVNMLSEEQMRQLLLQFAANDSFIREKILLAATAQLPKSQKQQWMCDLQQLTDDVEDRYGYIDYEDAYDYCCSLQEYLYNRVPDMLKKGLIADAFELVCLVFRTGMEQNLDDSDGGLTVLANYCIVEWDRILTLASLEQQKGMYRWFCEEYNQGDLKQMFLEDYIFQAPWDAKIAPELLSFLDQQIQCAEEGHKDYRLNDLVAQRISWMDKIGISRGEREKYIHQKHFLSSVREIEITEAKRNRDWDAALLLLRESVILDAAKIGLVERYTQQIIEIYEMLNDIPSIKKELENYLFTFRQSDLIYVEKMKSLLSECEWLEMRGRLLTSKTMQYQRYELLCREGLYAQLMEMIETHGFINTLQQYEDVLKKEFSQRCIRMYEKNLHLSMQQASNRKAYWSVIQTLKKLNKYPNGTAISQAIADQWKQQYPRRTSLLDELKKAGF